MSERRTLSLRGPSQRQDVVVPRQSWNVSETRRERLKEGIRQAIERGASLTQQLLAFSRRSPLKSEVVDLGPVWPATCCPEHKTIDGEIARA